VLRGEFDCCLDVLGCSGIDADDGHAPLLAWNAEGSVEVAGLDGPVGKGVGLPVGVFSSGTRHRMANSSMQMYSGSFWKIRM